MRLLLDENLDRRLKQSFGTSHHIETVADRGWHGKKNGELLQLAAADFDVFITADQNLQHQQNLQNFDLAVVFVAGKTSRRRDVEPLIPEILRRLQSIKPGTVIRVP